MEEKTFDIEGKIDSGLESLESVPPFELEREVKEPLQTRILSDLTQFHRENCSPYDRILDSFYSSSLTNLIGDFPPFIPARLLKLVDLKSVPSSEVMMSLTSSGTSGQTPSRVSLSKSNARLQNRALVRILGDFFGTKRQSILIFDEESTLREGKEINARAAGVRGFSSVSREKIIALNETLDLEEQIVTDFLEGTTDVPFLAFGFTSVLWEKVILPLEASGRKFPPNQGVLIHGGGWKALVDQAVSPQEFSSRARSVLGVRSTHDYYGMAEQTGSIFMACENRVFHCSNYSDVLVRDPRTLQVNDFGQEGLLQVISVLPRSYPGHSILTEDIGTIQGEDDCSCGRKGKYFVVAGRLAQAEIRGCSDTATLRPAS